ncbi:hypothetical protein KJ359_003550 [Pestalotiopsis sp. 9143b]|nr:hypothetical protein KJ359_003550 [Pestalotiopsis sp. 9143b]
MVGGPFALPLPIWRQAVSVETAEGRKRKRKAEAQADDHSSQDDEPPTPSGQSSDTINPLSHSPNTLRQFSLAGLSPEEELPSKAHPNFPHRSLPPGWQTGDVRHRRSRSRSAAATSESEADADTDGEAAGASSRRAQRSGELLSSHADIFKHMSTMMAILHRCIHEGDMVRAKRAFRLLLGTRDVDIRLNDMWTLGAEILMRDGETTATKKQQQQGRRRGEEEEEEDPEDPADDTRPPPSRWGSADNMEKVRDYLETLAQHYPYDIKFNRSVNAVDFWPALYNIEIYNVDAEHRRALHRLEESAALEEEDGDNDQSHLPESDEDNDHDYESRFQRRAEKREEERAKRRWAARDEISHETRIAAQHIAERMDNLMMAAPYTTHVELLRLRGMLSLFIGDLHLPSRLLRISSVAESAAENGLGATTLKERLRNQPQSQEDREAVWRWESEVDKARQHFERMVEKGVRLEPWLEKYLDPDEDADISR